VFKKLNPSSYEEFIRDFKVETPAKFNFAFDVIDRKASQTPDATALIHVDLQGKRRDFSYRYFAEESARLANALIKKGVAFGDRVMMILHRRVEFWVATLALHKIGAVGIPSPFLLTVEDVAERAKFAGVRAVIAEHGVAARIDEVRAKVPDIRLWVDVGEADPVEGWTSYGKLIETGEPKFERTAEAPGGEDLMLLFFSSGTTGFPKMVEHNYFYPLGHIVTASYWQNLEPGDIHLSVADSGWAKTMWGKFYGQWMAGAIVFVYDFREKFSPRELLKQMADNKVSTFCAPPTVYRFFVRENLADYDLSALRYCTTAGETIEAAISESWTAKTGLKIHEGYGQTETTLLVGTFPFMEVRPGSIGKPAPGWKVELINTECEPVGVGEEGEICVNVKEGAPLGLFARYHGAEKSTVENCTDGYYHTGDKAVRDADGYLWFMGRTDDVIKSAGYRIGPFEVESALASHPAVVEAAVTGIPDLARGQAVKATIVLAKGYTPSKELTAELQAHVKQHTAIYKMPRVIEYVDALPKTISGKIKRVEIRERDWAKANTVEKIGSQAAGKVGDVIRPILGGQK
jgi:acetyl-CoA synthetase